MNILNSIFAKEFEERKPKSTVEQEHCKPTWWHTHTTETGMTKFNQVSTKPRFPLAFQTMY